MSSRMPGRRETTGVMPYWLPLGASGHSVRWNGRLFEAGVVSAKMADDDPVRRASSRGTWVNGDHGGGVRRLGVPA